MKKFLIIPNLNDLTSGLELAEKYDLGFEFNDFFYPDILDDKSARDAIISKYKSAGLPGYCTLHGAFFDVIAFSPDKKIREISDLRIKQSIGAAEEIGAKAVVFHTNYNPFLNSAVYIKDWLNKNAEYWDGILNAFPDMNIYLENMFDNTPKIMTLLAKILSAHSNFGICLDYAHASLTKVSGREWMESLGPYTRHMHINDNDFVSDLHLAVGNGLINWNEFYSLYNSYIKDSTILIETSSVENQQRSIERLLHDKFMDCKAGDERK